jgi:hypothetical protein
VFTVAVNPTGGGEVQLRGTTDRTGDQVAYFDDVWLEVVGHEEPRRDVVVLGNAALGLTGFYHPEGRVNFDGRPVEDWEFMATGTGVTGLTVNFPDELIVLPCWPEKVPVDFTLCSPYAGRVELHYRPADMLRVATQREIRVRTSVSASAVLQVARLRAEGR